MRREIGPGDDVLHVDASAVGGRVDVGEAPQLGSLGIAYQFIFLQIEMANCILHQKGRYYLCCLRDVIVKIDRYLSNTIQDTLISGVYFSWTTPYFVQSGIPDVSIRADTLGHILVVVQLILVLVGLRIS